jgi:hypothetical protein
MKALSDPEVLREARALRHDMRTLHDRLDALSARIERDSSLHQTLRDFAVSTEIVVDRLMVDAHIYPA